MFESRAAVASSEAADLFSVTVSEDSEGGTDSGAGVCTVMVCAGVEGICTGSESSARPVARCAAESAFGWGIG